MLHMQTAPPAVFRRLRWMFLLFIIGGFTAAAWDAWWHTQYEFDGFFSPPHVLAYTVSLVLAWLINRLILNDRFRRWFGVGFRVPVLPYPVPGALVILAAGVILLGFAGLVLDNFWHTWFGLNETSWSFPHAMIGWGLLITVLGFTASRMALGRMNVLWKFFLGWLIVVMLSAASTGPLGRNVSPEMVAAEAQIPVLAAQEETRHLYRIYLENNLTRTNPMLIVLAPLGAAAGLAFVRRMHSRPWLMLGVALLVSISGDRATAERLIDYAPALLDDPANYAPIPLIWLAGIYALARWLRASERAAWALGGLVFGLMLQWTFGVVPGMEILAPVGGLTAVIGAWAGNHLYELLREPSSWRRIAPLLIAGLMLPFITGLVDLYWRLTTA